MGENATDDKKNCDRVLVYRPMPGNKAKACMTNTKRDKFSNNKMQKKKKKKHGWECEIDWAKTLKTNKNISMSAGPKNIIKLSATGVQRLGQSEGKRT